MRTFAHGLLICFSNTKVIKKGWIPSEEFSPIYYYILCVGQKSLADTNNYNYVCSSVNGLCREDTEEAPIFPDVWKQIEPKIEGLPLVAHNKAFDETCLKAVFRLYQMDYPDYPFYCTLIKSRKVWPGGPHALDVIAERCGYDLKNHHQALADAEACAAIALKIL